MRQIVLDTETTGLSPADGDRIIEIGCVELLNRKLTGRNLHHYINPERDSHPDALRVHGLTTEFLSDKPKFAAIAPELLDYLAGADEVIIHNAPFDVGFLNAEFERLGLPPFTERVGAVVDSLAMAKDMFPGQRNGLDALCSRLGVDNSGRTLHGALLDAELLADVYIGMTRGQDALLMDVEAGGDANGHSGAAELMDLSGFVLPVIAANTQEADAHTKTLADIDKASKGKTVWRRHEPAPAE